MPENDSETLSTDELVEILEQSKCHRDLIRYVKRADEMDDPPAMLESMKYSLNYVTVAHWADRGTMIEEAIYERGAAGALECGNLDVTNTEICESIMEDYH